jgi:hypothetical protein
VIELQTSEHDALREIVNAGTLTLTGRGVRLSTAIRHSGHRITVAPTAAGRARARQQREWA